MDRFNTAAGSASPPSAPSAPANPYFTKGNPGSGIPATQPGEWWFHMVTEEIRKVIVDGGLTPDFTNLTQLSAAIQALIAAGAATVTGKNGLINGGCLVAQRAAPNISTTAQYGQVDRFAAWGTGTAVSAGTITQSTTSPVGRTATGLRLAGVTITGTGVVLVRHRIESKDALRFKNQTASFKVLAQHDVGSSINYTVTIRKPTVADNYGSTTTIATSSAQALASATPGSIKLENVAMGDCSNGIEIEVSAACGAITTKNFDFAEFMFDLGASTPAFEHKPLPIEFDACQRFYEKLGGVTGTFREYFYSAGVDTVWRSYTFLTRKRAAPTMAKVGTWTVSNCGQPSVSASHDGGFTLQAVMSGAGAVSLACADGTTYLTADAEL